MYQYNVSYLNDQKKLYSPRIFFSTNTIPNTKENLDHNLKQQKYLHCVLCSYSENSF